MSQFETRPEPIRIELMGERFSLKGTEDKEAALAAADRLNQEIESIDRRYPGLTPKQTALLAAFNLTDELLKTQKEYRELTGLLDRD